MPISQSSFAQIRHIGLGHWLMFFIMITGGLNAAAQPKLAAPADPQPSSRDERQKAAPLANGPLISNADLVTFTVSVVDPNGHYVSGLRPSDFALTDNQIPKQITSFSDEDVPVSIAVIVDVSGSVSSKSLARANEALANFVNSSHADDEYFLIAFNASPQLLLDGSRDGGELIRQLSSVKPDGNTALYDAVYLALDRIAHGTYRRRELLIISDGEDNNSRHTFNQLRRSLMESDVTIYGIDVNARPLPKEFYGRLVLDELASSSGGKIFTPGNTAKMNEAFAQIASDLRHRYSIGYRPAHSALDGKWHRLKVKVTPPPDLKRVLVRARAGYYAIRASP